MGPRLLARAWVSIHEASGPSPGLPRLASSPRQTVLSQSGEEASVARTTSSIPPCAMCAFDSSERGGQEGVGAASNRSVRAPPTTARTLRSGAKEQTIIAAKVVTTPSCLPVSGTLKGGGTQPTRARSALTEFGLGLCWPVSRYFRKWTLERPREGLEGEQGSASVAKPS